MIAGMIVRYAIAAAAFWDSPVDWGVVAVAAPDGVTPATVEVCAPQRLQKVAFSGSSAWQEEHVIEFSSKEFEPLL